MRWNVRQFALFFLMFINSSAVALAQDQHPLQSQAFFRLKGTARDPGPIEVVVPKSLPEFRYFEQGDPVARVEPNAMFLFDKSNPLPKTRLAGSNYLFTEGGALVTLSAEGFLYYKGITRIEPGLAGGVYFLDRMTGEVIVIDSYGFFIRSGQAAKNVRVLGGNYFIDQDGLLTTIKSSGIAPGSPVGILTEKHGWNFSDVVLAGGSFFFRADGTMVTIHPGTGFFSDRIIPPSAPRFAGGNFFVGQDGVLYTLDHEARIHAHPEVRIPVLPAVIGSSFLVFPNQKIIAIDSDGNPHLSLVRVSATGLRVRIVDAIESAIDLNSVFQPRILN